MAVIYINDCCSPAKTEHVAFALISVNNLCVFSITAEIAKSTQLFMLTVLCLNFNYAMHCSAKRGLAIACLLSVCDFSGSGLHRLKILESNCANN